MDNNTTTIRTTSNITFSCALTLIFITLKLIGKISWSWVWVLAPLWISASISLIIFLITIIITIIALIIEKKS